MNQSFDVGKNTVRIFQKKGRTLITCSCLNGTKFCNEPTICYHKNEVLRKIYLDKFEKKVNKVIKEYESFQLLKLKASNDLFLDELRKLREEIKKCSVII
jgi:hypothetical protein